jgi:predicted nucleic acid-binding protein
VSEAWVVNASPVILFSRIGRLDLIERLALQILIPNAVIDEVRAGQGKDPTAAAALKWAEQYRVDDVTVPASVEHWDLGAGESQVIAHCVGATRWSVLDDRAARRCALAHGVPVVGSVGVVLRSKKNGNLDQARPIIERLIAAGMFLDDELVDRILLGIGE